MTDIGDVDFGLLVQDVIQYEAKYDHTRPYGWYEACKVGNAEGANQAGVTKLLEGMAAIQATLDAKLGVRKKLIRPCAKFRCLEKHKNDVDATVADILEALQLNSVSYDSASALKAGLITKLPADHSAFPDAFADVVCGENEHRGKLVADGGNLDPKNLEAYRKMVELSGGPEKAVIGVLNICVHGLDKAYDSEWGEHGTWYCKWNWTATSFAQAGLPRERLLHVPLTLDTSFKQSDKDIIEVLRKCTGLWIPGGENYRAVRCLFHHYPCGKRTVASATFDTIHGMYKKGLCICTTSASSFQTTQGPLLTGGGSIYRCLSLGAKIDPGSNYNSAEMTYDASGGFAFLSGWSSEAWESAIVEAHCLKKCRMLRLIRLLADTKDKPKGTTYGIGIAENTQLVVDHSTGIAEILGFQPCQFVDISKASTPSDVRPFGIKGVIYHQLTRGDKLNLRTGEITIASWKQKCTPSSGKQVFCTTNVCKEPYCTQKMAESLVQADVQECKSTSAETDPVFAVAFAKTANTQGFVGTQPSEFSKTTDYVSILSLEVSILPE